MTPEQWLYTPTTYGSSHNSYVANLYWDLLEKLETSFLLKTELDDSQRFSRLANILFKHSALFREYR